MTTSASRSTARRETSVRTDIFGLAVRDAEAGAGPAVILSDADGGMLAHLVAGARGHTLGGAAGGRCVRRGGEDAP